MGMTTSLSPNPKMLRGSWSRTLVSRTKFFFTPRGSGARGALSGTPSRSLPGARLDHTRASRRRAGRAPRPAEAGRRDGLVPPVALGVVQTSIRPLDELRLGPRVVRERGRAQGDGHPERALRGLVD